MTHTLSTPDRVLRITDLAQSAGHLDAALAALASGGIIVLPTETVYGAAGLLQHPEARKRLHALKPSAKSTPDSHPAPPAKPLTPHVHSPDQAMQYLGEVPEIARRMMKKLWPGPVGLTFDVSPIRQKEVASALGVAVSDIYDNNTVTLRCPDHPAALAIIAGTPSPVVLTSAATVGGHPALRADDLGADVLAKVDLVLDAGPSRFTRPSTLIRIEASGKWAITRTGVYDQRIIDRMLKTTILFVCSGNTCRSPMAQVIAQNAVAQKLGVSPAELQNRQIQVLSAGTFAHPGAPASHQAQEAAAQLGLDLSRHRSQPLTVELLHSADIVFAMTRSHLSAATSMAPDAAGKIQLLQPSKDIDDPFGSDVPVYLDLAKKMQSLIPQAIDRVKVL